MEKNPSPIVGVALAAHVAAPLDHVTPSARRPRSLAARLSRAVAARAGGSASLAVAARPGDGGRVPSSARAHRRSSAAGVRMSSDRSRTYRSPGHLRHWSLRACVTADKQPLDRPKGADKSDARLCLMHRDAQPIAGIAAWRVENPSAWVLDREPARASWNPRPTADQAFRGRPSRSQARACVPARAASAAAGASGLWAATGAGSRKVRSGKGRADGRRAASTCERMATSATR